MCERTRVEILARELAFEYYSGTQTTTGGALETKVVKKRNIIDRVEQNHDKWMVTARRILGVLEDHLDEPVTATPEPSNARLERYGAHQKAILKVIDMSTGHRAVFNNKSIARYASTYDSLFGKLDMGQVNNSLRLLESRGVIVKDGNFWKRV